MFRTIVIPLAICLFPLAAIIGAFEGFRRYQRRNDRRSPFTKALLRPPGHTLALQLDDMRWGVVEAVAISMSIPGFIYALYLQQRVSGNEPDGSLTIIYLLIALAVFAYALKKGLPLFGKAGRRLRLGLEAEQAVGDALLDLGREGFWIFHDVPGGDTFNIDHVAVGPSGVFVIETKGRPKLGRDETEGHRVRFDGSNLIFPAWRESEPIKQARMNARWLQDWLRSAVGESVFVRPVVALPGWFVERTTGDDPLLVLNEKQLAPFLANQKGGGLNVTLTRRIAHQLDGRCRDVKLKAYVNADQRAADRR